MLKKIFLLAFLFIVLLVLAAAGIKLAVQHHQTLKTLSLKTLRQELRNLEVLQNEGIIRSWGFAFFFDSKNEKLGPDRILDIAQYSPELYNTMFEDAGKRALAMAQERLSKGIWAAARSISHQYHHITTPINDINPETDLVEEGILERGILLLKKARKTNAVITTTGKVEINLEIDINGPLSLARTLGFENARQQRPFSHWEKILMHFGSNSK